MKTSSVFVRATLAAVVSFVTYSANAVQTTEVSDYSGGSTSPAYNNSLTALASETTTSGLAAGGVSHDVGVYNRDFGMFNRDFRMHNRDFRMHNRDYSTRNRDFRMYNRDFGQ